MEDNPILEHAWGDGGRILIINFHIKQLIIKMRPFCLSYEKFPKFEDG